MQQIVRKGGEREKARQIRRPRRVDRAMSVCTLAAQFLRPSAHGLTCEQIVKAFLLTLLCCHFCFGSGVSPSGAKKTFATFPGKRQFHSSRSQAPSARGGKGAPTTTTSSFQLSPQRNSRTTNPSPPFPPLPHFSRWMTSRPHHHQHFIFRRRRPGFPIEFRK